MADDEAVVDGTVAFVAVIVTGVAMEAVVLCIGAKKKKDAVERGGGGG